MQGTLRLFFREFRQADVDINRLSDLVHIAVSFRKPDMSDIIGRRRPVQRPVTCIEHKTVEPCGLFFNPVIGRIT